MPVYTSIDAGRKRSPEPRLEPAGRPLPTECRRPGEGGWEAVWNHSQSRNTAQPVLSCSTGCPVTVAITSNAAGWLALSALADKTVGVGNPEPERARWPEHLPVGALRVVRWTAHYDQTVSFYRDLVGLAVLETFHDSYGLDGTILGLPGGPVHLEIVRLPDARHPAPGLDQLVFYLPDAAAQERITARLAAAGLDPVAQIDYWEANGGVTYQDPDGREVVFTSWIYRPPDSN
jgi:hypothetical protein